MQAVRSSMVRSLRTTMMTTPSVSVRRMGGGGGHGHGHKVEYKGLEAVFRKFLPENEHVS
jgi:hypothetical protein